MSRVAVTDLEYDKAANVFGCNPEGFECLRAPTPELALAEFIRSHGARHAIVGAATYTGPLYDALPAGGVLARFGVGHDGINKALATARGLVCTNTPGVLDDSVAEYAIALLLAAARRLPLMADATRRGEYRPVMGTEVRGKRLAIIGCGSIGRRVARIAASGLQMQVIGSDPREAQFSELRRECGFTELTTQFEQAVTGTDFVSLHLPGGRSTWHFVNAERLAAIPRSAWLINTARGSVIDEAALFDALAVGSLAGAALDVSENEPYVPVAPDKDLRTLENVILMPHAASSTHEACTRMGERAIHNIVLAELGRFRQMDVLNPDVLQNLREVA